MYRQSRKYQLCQISFFQDSISHFSRRVRSLPGSMSPFDRPGRNTFFVPVDSAFEDLSVELLTQDVVRAHVVPGEVIFHFKIVFNTFFAVDDDR